MIFVPPVSLVLAGINGFCGSLDHATTFPLPAPEALLPLLLEPELEPLLPEQAVSRRAAADAATRPRAARVETAMLRLLNVLGSSEPGWIHGPRQATGACWSIDSGHVQSGGATSA